MNHLKQIAAGLDEYGLDAMLVTSAPGEFYAVGFHGEGAVVVTSGECRYFTDSRYIEAAEKQVAGAHITMTDRSKNIQALVKGAVEELGVKKLGFEDGYMTVAQYNRYAGDLPCALTPANQLISKLRAAKDAEEIELMKKAQEITDKAFSEIIRFIRPGMTEREIAARLQYDMLRLGADEMSFDPIVVTGPNGSLPHGIPGDTRLEPGNFLTMDFGCVYNGYCSDMTRTVAIGAPTAEMKKVYDTVLAAQAAGIAASRAGVTGKSIDAAARRVIELAGYGPYFGHGYGHSLGIEGKETPLANTVDDTPMPVGAVVSAEPGIYLPGRFGVRIEDVVVMQEGGCLNLTHAPKELIIL